MAASFAAIGLETVPPSLFNHTRSLPTPRGSAKSQSNTAGELCTHCLDVSDGLEGNPCPQGHLGWISHYLYQYPSYCSAPI